MNVDLSALGKGLLDNMDIRKVMQEIMDEMSEEMSPEMLQEMNAAAEALQLENTSRQLSVRDTVSLSGNNLMERNFAAESEESKYLAAAKNAKALENDLKNKMQSSVMDCMPEEIRQAAFWNDPRLRTAKQLKDATEAHKDTFDEMKRNIEERVERAQAPDSENGDATGNAASEAVSGSVAQDPIPAAPEATAAQATTSAQATATSSPAEPAAEPAPETDAAPSSASIDITV